jgi:hypothetical protein
MSEPTFIAECFWPNVGEQEVDDGAERVRRSAAELTAEGHRVSFAGTILVPGDEVVFYLFDGESADDVQAACMRAGIPLERVVESIRSGAPEAG